MPPYEGSELTCNRTPEERLNSILFIIDGMGSDLPFRSRGIFFKFRKVGKGPDLKVPYFRLYENAVISRNALNKPMF
jgi:hypothetical protein